LTSHCNLEDHAMRWDLPLVALFALTALPAGATSPTEPPRQPVDANGDGVVTREEAQTHPRLAASFDAADTNKDGRLDAAELDAMRQAHRAEARARADERWKSADTNGDGAISRDEAQKSMPRMAENFDKLDVNSDGKIERSEMHQARKQWRGGRPDADDAT
jgi:Ca2+-binding EF-hand superfamily protein